MALTTTWKGQLKISLISFPVRLYAAVSGTSKLALNQLHKQCHSRIQLDSFCPEHGKLAKSEITNDLLPKILFGIQHHIFQDYLLCLTGCRYMAIL